MRNIQTFIFNCKIIWTLVFVFLYLINEKIVAQVPTPVFRHFTIRDGLPSSEVYQVIQDRKGFIWCATDRGVCRFNGYEFENFATEQGLPDNTIFFLYEDYKGRIWFVPSNKKLSYFENEKIHLYPFNHSLDTFDYRIPISFKITKSDEIIMSLSSRQIIMLDAKGKLTVPAYLNSFPGVEIFEIEGSYIVKTTTFSEMDNKLLINGGVYTLDPGDTIDNIRISATKIGKDHFLISHDMFLYELKNQEFKKVFKSNSSIINLYAEKGRKIWLGTTSDGVYKLDMNNSFILERNYFPNTTITGIFCDQQNGLWFTSRTEGIYYLPEQNILCIKKGTELKTEDITCISNDNENFVYAGCENSDVYRLNTHVIEKLDLPPFKDGSGQRYGILISPDKKTIYLSSNSNLQFIKNNQFREWKVSAFSNLFPDHQKNLWGGNISQLFKIVGDTFKIECDNIMRIKAICELPDKRMLMATILGIFEYKGNCKFLPFMEENKLLRLRADDIKVTSDSLILIATRGSGFLIINNDSVYKITSQNGLASDFVQNICADGNDYWLSTNRGISQVHIQKYPKLRFSVYTIRNEDGLPSNQINGMTILHDTVWAATNSGIAFFKKSDLIKDLLRPRVFISSVNIGEKDTVVLKHYDIPFDKNNITLSFVAPVYRGTSNIEYKYRVSGLENTWHYTKDRSIKLLSLPAGNYRFEVFAGNRSGVWSLSPAVISFCILPPFYQTWWFILSCIGLSGIIIYTYTNNRINRIKKTEQAKTEFNRKVASLETKALRAQMNPHFTFNVMNSIQHYILEHDSASAQKYLSKFAKLIRLILDNSGFDEIPLADELKALKLYVELEQLRFSTPFEFELKVDETININELLVPSLMLQPYIENAIKHGIIHLEKTGKIAIHISKNSECILFVIQDNGVGRAKAAEWNKINVQDHISHGTVITRDRIQAYNVSKGTNLKVQILDLKDADNNPLGTRVEIYIPFI